MKYKVTFNLPGSKFPSEVSISREQMEKLNQAISVGARIVEIDGSYFNTAYFVQAVPDNEVNVLETHRIINERKGIVSAPEELAKRIEATKGKYQNLEPRLGAGGKKLLLN